MKSPRRVLATAASLALAHAFRLPADACNTVGGALRAATDAFSGGGVPEPVLSAEHLLAQAAGFGSNRGALSLQRDEVMSKEAIGTFEQMCKRRLRREPVQYILGEWDFDELTLALRAPVLIPRPETEELVQHVLRGQSGNGALRILDVGCGSGAIGLALLHHLPAATCVGIDVSSAATTLATENAASCGVAARYEAVLVDGGIAAYELGDQRPFDLIVSNPPYIPRPDMASLEPEVSGHEDDRALCGGEDGLDVVRELLTAAPMLLDPRGARSIWLEVDTSHPPLIEAWTKDAEQAEIHLEFVRGLADMYGRPRFVELAYRPEDDR